MDAGFNEDLKRIETKVDKLTDAVTRLILVEERQTAQGVRITSLEDKTEELEYKYNKVDRKVERWVNMGMGAWAIVVVIFAFVQLVAKLQH
jgi:hypothetical protein